MKNSVFDQSQKNKVYDGLIRAKLGTAKNPARVTVPTKIRARELEAVFKKNKWHHEITVDAKKPEDTADLDSLLNPVKQVTAGKKVGRNDPCPCGSGKKYKKCCGK